MLINLEHYDLKARSLSWSVAYFYNALRVITNVDYVTRLNVIIIVSVI